MRYALLLGAGAEWAARRLSRPGPGDAFHPLQEPRVWDFFRPLENFRGEPQAKDEYVGPTAQIPRLNNPSSEEVKDLVRRGQPFVVEGLPAYPMANWSCEDIAKRWPTGDMRDEYDHHSRVRVGDSSWYTKIRKAKRTYKGHVSEGARVSAPYVWHVKDETPAWMKKEVQEEFVVPRFLEDSPVNSFEIKDSIELWFHVSGGAAFAHADSYCEPTASWQISGVKRWREMMYPESGSVRDRFNSFDEGIYKTDKWLPEYDFKVNPGELHFFPPNYIHETYVTPEENPGCTIAFTVQWQFPNPVRSLRAFYPRYINSALGYEENCQERWHRFVHFSPKAPKTTLNEKTWEQQASDIIELVDANKDFDLTFEEVKRFFASHPKGAWAKSRRSWSFGWSKMPGEAEIQRMEKEVTTATAEDTFHYHDVDEDGVVTACELWMSLAQWHVVNSQASRVKKQKRNPREVAETEAKFQAKYNASGVVCPFAVAVEKGEL